jgi:hypothetical protein
LVGRGFGVLLDRIFERLPKRAGAYRRIRPFGARREANRRAALAVLVFLGVVLGLGLGSWYLGGAILGRDPQVSAVNAGETALRAARDRIQRVFGPDDLVITDPERATQLLREAWGDLTTAAAAGVSRTTIQPLRDQVGEALEGIYRVGQVSSATVHRFQVLSPEARLEDLSRGPDGAAYVIDSATQSVLRVDVPARAATQVIAPGALGEGVRPILLGSADADLVVLDSAGGVWRWRPSDAAGQGTLSQLVLGGDRALQDSQDLGTFPQGDGDTGLYRLYFLDPGASTILRYIPTADGSAWDEPTDYLTTPDEDLASMAQMAIDSDIYTLSSEILVRFRSQRRDTGFELAIPPDDGDLRPGHDYRLVTHTGTSGTGRLYVWDARHERVLVFDKADGAYVEQYRAVPESAPFEDLRGMYIVEGAAGEPPVLMWLTASRLLSAVLEPSDTTTGPGPDATPVETPTATPAGTGTPAAGTAAPTATPTP